MVERLAAAGEHSDDPPVGEITTDTGSFAALIWHGGSLEHALSSGKLRLSADRSGLVQFLTRFGRPATVQAAAE